MKNFLKWTLGLLMFLLGANSFISSGFFSGVVLFVGGLICIPQTLEIIEEKIRFKFKSYQKYLLVILLIFLGASFLPQSLINQLSESTQTEQPSSKNLTQSQKDSLQKLQKEEINNNTITSNQLVFAYEENEVNADNNLKGRVFYVTGKITSIKKDIMDDIYVTLDGGNSTFREVQCFFNNPQIAGELKKGMKVMFKGKCDGLMGNVLMKECELIKD